MDVSTLDAVIGAGGSKLEQSATISGEGRPRIVQRPWLSGLRPMITMVILRFHFIESAVAFAALSADFITH